MSSTNFLDLNNTSEQKVYVAYKTPNNEMIPGEMLVKQVIKISETKFLLKVDFNDEVFDILTYPVNHNKRIPFAFCIMNRDLYPEFIFKLTKEFYPLTLWGCVAPQDELESLFGEEIIRLFLESEKKLVRWVPFQPQSICAYNLRKKIPNIFTPGVCATRGFGGYWRMNDKEHTTVISELFSLINPNCETIPTFAFCMSSAFLLLINFRKREEDVLPETSFFAAINVTSYIVCLTLLAITGDEDSQAVPLLDFWNAILIRVACCDTLQQFNAVYDTVLSALEHKTIKAEYSDVYWTNTSVSAFRSLFRVFCNDFWRASDTPILQMRELISRDNIVE